MGFSSVGIQWIDGWFAVSGTMTMFGWARSSTAVAVMT
jgi:hypothetical protein